MFEVLEKELIYLKIRKLEDPVALVIKTGLYHMYR